MFSQISRVVFILIFINVANGLGDSNGIDLSKCSYLKTNDYAYSFYPIQEVKNGSGIFLTFKVKAKRDALIIFSPTNEPAKNGQQVFEVVLGGYGNTRSTIRTTPKGGEEISYNETNIVSSEKWNHFWIRINSNGSLIEVGKNNSDGSSAIMTFKTKPRTIKYYGFSSWNYENEVEWAFQCSKNDNSVEDVSKCRAVNTDEYVYTYYPIDDIKTATGIFLTFNVKAGRDALIIFSPTNQPNKTEKVFEVVLGGYRNTRSMIRITPTGGEVTTRNETDILSPEKWRKFWIRINSNGSLIEVGKHGRPAFMSVKNQSRPIKYYGFASWIDKNPVNWTFSCIQNNKTDQCHPTSLTTTKYDYQLFPIDYLVKNEHGILLNFSVKAERDAHILLSSTNQTVSRGQNDYEIVLGSHRNTKSEIRPSTNESNEKDIVTLKEWRTFWIRVSSDGLIEVGKNGNKSSFMSWNATGGTNFTHFGFASWNGNTVNWMIHCSQIRDDKNKTKNDKILAKDLLTNYSRSTPPNGNGTFLDQANITIVIQNSTFSDPESVEINGLAKIT
ncbi:uncharacterized protein LOC135833330 [Planococcus citri]|uniref:uncharacterized protein LOC135833330 n=1 Tax=Planococcus citri TaxID=170843 RepID=UPI0031F76B18